jgi:hypothetical protein
MSVNIAIIFKNNQMLTEIALAHISIVLDNHSWTTFLLFKVVRVKDSGLTYNFNILRPESNFGEDFGHRVTRYRISNVISDVIRVHSGALASKWCPS